MDKDEDRAARLAAALRANLHRRKARARDVDAQSSQSREDEIGQEKTTALK